MAERSRLRNLVEYAAVRSVDGIVGVLPGDGKGGPALAFSQAVMRALDAFVPKLRRVAMRNLELAYPDLDEAGRRRIADGVFRSLGRMLLVYSRLPRMHADDIGGWIRYDGLEHFTRAIEQGRGVLFATAHFGNWELSAFAHALMTAPMHVVVRPLDNPLLDEFVERRRSASGNRIIGKREYVRGILEALRRREAVGILTDQNESLDRGVFIDFFGIKACTGPAFAKLAWRSGAAVIPGYAVWCEQEGRYILRFQPEVKMTGDAVADTQAIHGELEAAIRRNPDQWLWVHRRWKTRPPGEPPLYR